MLFLIPHCPYSSNYSQTEFRKDTVLLTLGKKANFRYLSGYCQLIVLKYFLLLINIEWYRALKSKYLRY